MYAPAQNRTVSALAAALIVAGGLVGVIAALSLAPSALAPGPVLEAILPAREHPLPPPSPPRQQKGASGAREAPAPEARKNDAAQVIVPPARRPPLIASAPLPVATMADQGSAQDGQGQGGGGTGNGSGAGGTGDSGDEAGSEANANAAVYPRQVAGKLYYDEIPKNLRRNHGGVVRLRYRIDVDGRVNDCTILQSSGMPDFDRDTCSRITARFRFRAARDAQGHAIPFVMIETHGWDYEP